VEQLRQGWVVLHVFAAVYLFILLAIVCNDYFLPSVECICEDLNITKDVAAATFMATATAMPEFFTNTVGTLLTDSDIGLGTIIGALMFNILGVGGLGALAVNKVRTHRKIIAEFVLNQNKLCIFNAAHSIRLVANSSGLFHPRF